MVLMWIVVYELETDLTWAQSYKPFEVFVLTPNSVNLTKRNLHSGVIEVKLHEAFT